MFFIQLLARLARCQLIMCRVCRQEPLRELRKVQKELVE